MKNKIRTGIRLNYPCACDYPTSKRILNNYAAPYICQATCEDRGGWNGQWTNEYPAAPKGKVVAKLVQYHQCPLQSENLKTVLSQS